jgi:hypothetical protein
MKIIYIADDGSLFDNEYDCEAYEWKLNHPHLKDIHAFDKDGNEFADIFSEDTYNYSEKIIVSSEEAAKDMRDLAKYTGYCAYEYIDAVGEWVFDARKERFVKVV